MAGWQAPFPTARILASGLMPNSFAFSADMITMAADPSLRPLALPAVILPILGTNAGGQAAQLAHGQSRSEMFILVKISGWSFCGEQKTGTISSVKVPVNVGTFGIVMAAQGHFIHLFSRDTHFLGR